MRRHVCLVLPLSIATVVGCGEPIAAPDIEQPAIGQPLFAVFNTDPTATVTPVAGGFVLRKELGGFGNYGVADGRSDILYSPEDDQWNFDMSVISDGIVSATAVISLVLDDHYGRPESQYVGTITLNGTQVFSGGFSTLGVSHGVPFGGIFTNWQSVSFAFSDLAPSTYTVAIDNNTTGPLFGDWIAIDFIEIHVETTPPVIEVDLDIKPGSDPNSINCNNDKESIAVAILTTGDFDATTVDHTTVTFEGASETHVDKKTGLARRHEEDVDGDGDTDLVLHFRLGDTDLTCDSTEGTLSGETFDGQAIEGTDAVRMVDQGGGKP